MNIQTRGSFLKLKCPSRKTSAGQMALSYNGPTISNASAFEKKGHATIACLTTKFRGYRRVKSCTQPTM